MFRCSSITRRPNQTFQDFFVARRAYVREEVSSQPGGRSTCFPYPNGNKSALLLTAALLFRSPRSADRA